MQALILHYTGSATKSNAYIEGGTLYIDDSQLRVFDLTHEDYETLGKIKDTLDTLTGYSCTLIADPDTPSIDLNDISSKHPADLKTETYCFGYGNYTNPRHVSEFINVGANDLKQDWFDAADADLESATNKKFRKQKLVEAPINISRDKISTNNEYTKFQLCSNAYVCDFLPITALTSLEIDGITVTPAKTIVTYNTIILTNESETTTWIPGIGKAIVSLEYGYDVETPQGRLAGEFSKLFVAQKHYHANFAEDKADGLAATRQYSSATYSFGEVNSQDNRIQRDWFLRMQAIKKTLTDRIGFKIV